MYLSAPRKETALPTDTLDVDLHDAELTDEIHLVTELMVLASEVAGPLDQQTVDAVLGVHPPLDGGQQGLGLPEQRTG